jgi:predicted signal transduction protein with EAL and GGDEF domain
VQARELERLGCTHAQGYLFSRPLSTRGVEEILVANCPLGPKNLQTSHSVGATAKPPEWCHSSVPFEWPEEMLQSA